MPSLDPRQKAERISAIFRARKPIDILPDELIPGDLDEAYLVRAQYETIEVAAGRGAVAGYKIGLTTPIMQQLCGVDEPCYGAMFSSEIRHSPAEVRAADFCRVGIETEVAIRLGADLATGARAAVEAAVESCAAAIEVLEDLRHDYKRLSARSMVAGNVWNAGCVLGAPVVDWRRLDLATVDYQLTINGKEIGSGKGSDVMGNPLNALAWLADKLARDGRPLRKGMVVMTGSTVPIQFPTADDRAIVEVSGLGRAEFVAV